MPSGKGYSSEANKKKIQKAVKDGMITKKQVDKMSEGLLLGIIKKGGNKRSKKKKS
tara:strand:- start:34 stop:201 length:168 start_codon:yes stop_codon:yes gene_type:complete